MQIRFAAISDTGKKRSRNEDAVWAWIPESSPLDGFFVVADGMGGHDAGDVASRTTIEDLRTFVEEESNWGNAAKPLDGLESTLIDISTRLIEASESMGHARGMGSTATTAAFSDRQIHIAHVGDSRLYRWREGQLQQLSIDHSWVAEQQRRGWISEEQALHHPQKNILTQALGTGGELEVFRQSYPVRTGDRFLLCSDGLHGAVSEEQICEILREVENPDLAVARMIDSANAAGGPDNITAIVCDVTLSEEELAAPPLPEATLPIHLNGEAETVDPRPEEGDEKRRARMAELDELTRGEPPEEGIRFSRRTIGLVVATVLAAGVVWWILF